MKNKWDSQSSLFTRQIDGSIEADVHPQEEDQVDNAWENHRNPTVLEHGWKLQEEMRRDGGLSLLAFGG